MLLSTVEEELQKEPKVRPTSLFDTSEIEKSIVNDEQDTVKNESKNEIDSNETFSLVKNELNPAFDSDIEEGTNAIDGEKVRVGSRCSRRPSRRQR